MYLGNQNKSIGDTKSSFAKYQQMPFLCLYSVIFISVFDFHTFGIWENIYLQSEKLPYLKAMVPFKNNHNNINLTKYPGTSSS